MSIFGILNKFGGLKSNKRKKNKKSKNKEVILGLNRKQTNDARNQ